MNSMKNSAALVGRALLALLFIAGGFEKLTGYEGTAGYIASKGLPLPQLAVGIAILAEIGGGLLLAAGWKTRFAALLLAAFALAVSFLFHDFWNMADEVRAANLVLFFKNFAIIGGLLTVAAFGPGRYSVDKT